METNYYNPLAACESVPEDDFLLEDRWTDADIGGNWLDPAERYIAPRYTLSYNGVKFAPLGGIHGLTGQPGHGKTFTFTQIMIAILRGEYYGLRYELGDEVPHPKVLYIDTEMEKGNTQLVMLRVYEMMGWQVGSEHEDFRVLWLREEVRAEDRWRKTLKAISVMQPTVVFLDGLIDVVSDFNDNKECQQMIYKCMATASHYGISMWCLLHENPGSEKMVGHAGSFLERKATDVLKTKKEKGAEVIFKVTQKKARARDLEDWQFRIEDGEHKYGQPVILGGTFTQENEDEELLQAISVIGTETITFTALRERVKKANGIGTSKAYDLINSAVRKGYLIPTNGKYRANPQDLFSDDENSIPF
ncbi:MAG: AAA family ATPase [Paludibacteraceae bacterium]